MSQLPLPLENLKLLKPLAIAKLLPYLRTPAALALLGSIGIHGIVLLSLPVNRLGSANPTIKTVSVVELTAAERSRLPKLSRAPVTSLPAKIPSFRFAPLPTTKLPGSFSLGVPGNSLGSTSRYGDSDLVYKSFQQKKLDQPEIKISLEQPKETELSTKVDTKDKPKETKSKPKVKPENLVKPKDQDPDTAASNTANSQPNTASQSNTETSQPTNPALEPQPGTLAKSPQIRQKLDQKIGKPVSQSSALQELSEWQQNLVNRNVPSELITRAQINRDAPTLQIRCPDQACAEKAAGLKVNPYFMLAVDKQGQVIGDVLMVATGDEKLDQAIVEEVGKFKPQPKPDQDYTVIHYKIKFEPAVG